MKTLGSKLDQIATMIRDLLDNPELSNESAMPGRAFFLRNGDVLALPRDRGDSRYPYGQNGYNFWAYASGYMHGNEGLFSTFLRATDGQEPAIAFFAGLAQGDGMFVPVPVLGVPRLHSSEALNVHRYTVFGHNAVMYVTEMPELRLGLQVFVTEEKKICFSLHVRNLTAEPSKLFLSAYFNPYLRNQIYESSEDKWFKETCANPASASQGPLGSFSIAVHEDKDRTTTETHRAVIQRGLSLAEGCSLSRQEACVSRYNYVGGSRSSLHTATALYEGSFGTPQHLCTFTETAVVGDLLHLDLGANGEARVDYLFAHTGSEAVASQLAREPAESSWIDAKLLALEESEREINKSFRVTVGEAVDAQFKPHVFNCFFEHLKKQVEFCALLKGYVQLALNSLIGIRDVFQALEGLLFWQPEAARKKMLEALGFTAPDGRCFRQYSLPTNENQTGRMDLRPFIDQGVWVVSCIYSYLKTTGDWSLLDESCGYHEILDEASGRVSPSEVKDSVLDHMIKITDYLLSKRDSERTGCIWALYGDWNDALDGLGISRDGTREYGTGVSVMATLQVYQNTQEMISILEGVDAQRYASQIDRYRQAAHSLEEGLRKYAIDEGPSREQKILHGWGDERSYLVGSFQDPDGLSRDGLTSNAFWVISGLYERDISIRDSILAAFERLDSKYGFKTFEPAFPPDAPGVGRIVKLPAGTAENGASYIHATAFGIMALFRMGCSREAWQQLAKILPFTALHENLSHSPFVMPNSYGYNPDKFIDGQNMNDWQTGSSNVVLKALVRYVFGFEPGVGGIWIQPASWIPFKSFEFCVRVRACDLCIAYRNDGADLRQFVVAGTPREGVLDECMGVDKLWIPEEELTGALRVQVLDRPAQPMQEENQDNVASHVRERP